MTFFRPLRLNLHLLWITNSSVNVIMFNKVAPNLIIPHPPGLHRLRLTQHVLFLLATPRLLSFHVRHQVSQLLTLAPECLYGS
jgi:hypothetical protein